jgi:hypothetical protein
MILLIAHVLLSDGKITQVGLAMLSRMAVVKNSLLLLSL